MLGIHAEWLGMHTRWDMFALHWSTYWIVLETAVTTRRLYVAIEGRPLFAYLIARSSNLN